MTAADPRAAAAVGLGPEFVDQLFFAGQWNSADAGRAGRSSGVADWVDSTGWRRNTGWKRSIRLCKIIGVFSSCHFIFKFLFGSVSNEQTSGCAPPACGRFHLRRQSVADAPALPPKAGLSQR